MQRILRIPEQALLRGLLDPEMADPIDGDKWSQKLATGSSMATYAYYDQIGGVEAASEIDGFKLQMYAPLEGPAGCPPPAQVPHPGSGIMFPKKTAERDDSSALSAPSMKCSI